MSALDKADVHNYPVSVFQGRAESFERKRERERETAGGLMGVEGAERMGRGPILARKKRNFGCFLCVAESAF